DAGTVISNRAEATYSDATGSSYSAVSLTVTITVLPVATLVVTPDETVSSDTIAPHDQVTRQFRICNTGNGVDTFSLTKVDLTEPATAGSLYFDVDGSGTVNDGDVPITLNETQTPQLAPRACVNVLAVINTNDLQPQSTLTISIVARSNATNAVNGRGEDVGTIVNAVGLGVRFTDLNNPDLDPSKLVNGLAQTVVSRAGEFSYVVAFKNSGDTAARNTVLQDLLPTATEYIPGSLQFNDRSLSDAAHSDERSVQRSNIKPTPPRVKPAD